MKCWIKNKVTTVLNILYIPIKRLICKHDWKCNGWTTVKCRNCGYVSRDIDKASEIINKAIDNINKTPAAHTTKGISDKAKMYYGDH